MEITCPNCGQTCEVDEEPMQGQHLLCPFCDVKFNYTPQNTTENDSYSIANTAETNVDAPTAKIQTTCPHCGATYEVDAEYIGETATCGTCDKAFVVKEAQAAEIPKEASSGGFFGGSDRGIQQGQGWCAPCKDETAATMAKENTGSFLRIGWKGCTAVAGLAVLVTVCGVLYFCRDVDKQTSENGDGEISISSSSNPERFSSSSSSSSPSSSSSSSGSSSSSREKKDGKIEYADGSVETIPYGMKKVSKESFKPYDVDRIQKITIPNSVTEIKYGVFNGHHQLASVVIPNSVTNIENEAFKSCDALTSITIPNSITSIGNGVFKECSSLSIVTLPNSITEIGEFVFLSCSNLTSVTIPNSVTSIGTSAFDGSDLKEITIPNSVTNIDSMAFANCHNLKSVVMPDGDVSVGSGAFENCTTLTSIRKSRGVMNVSQNAFRGCMRLVKNDFIIIGGVLYHYTGEKENVIIPNSVTSIEDGAFAGRKTLTSVTIPDSVKKIGQEAFSDCEGLTQINVSKGNAHYKSEKGLLLSRDGAILVKAIDVGSVVIPNSVKSIGKKAFYFCRKLENVTIPNTVTNIGESAFSFSGLRSVTIPGSVKSIGEYAFYLSDLRSAIISEGVMHIGARAFCCCRWLTKVTIPDSVTDIGDWAFGGCISLKTVSIPEAYADITNSSVFEACPCRSTHMVMRRVNVVDNIIGKDKSLRQYQDEAENGEIRAQYYLGMYYLETKNMTEAVKWLQLAAEKGHAGAQFEIGCIYVLLQVENIRMLGNGAGDNCLDVAARWWRKAAAQGHFGAYTYLQSYR